LYLFFCFRHTLTAFFILMIDASHNELRVPAHTKENPAHIFSDQSHKQKIDTREKADADHHRGPSDISGRTDNLLYNHGYGPNNSYSRKNVAKHGGKLQRHNRKSQNIGP